MKLRSETGAALVRIKLLHTAVWLFFAASIVGIPLVAAWRQLFSAGILSGLAMMECRVLAVNYCRCPLTEVARRYTDQRDDNFDIYLPLWLARYNKIIFGTLFALGELFTLTRWRSSGQ